MPSLNFTILLETPKALSTRSGVKVSENLKDIYNGQPTGNQ